MTFAVPFARTRWDEIVSGLFMGGHDYDELGKRGGVSDVIVRCKFDLVVSLFMRRGCGPADGVREIRASIPDGPLSAEDKVKVAALVPPIVAALTHGQKVLVRCQAGYNRSGLAVAMVLLAMGYTADDAINLIREKRSRHALCNELFVEYIHEAAKEATP